MKTKKLTLDRETVAPLTSSDLQRVAGGFQPFDTGCIPNPNTRFLCAEHTRQFISCAGPMR